MKAKATHTPAKAAAPSNVFAFPIAQHRRQGAKYRSTHNDQRRKLIDKAQNVEWLRKPYHQVIEEQRAQAMERFTQSPHLMLTLAIMENLDLATQRRLASSIARAAMITTHIDAEAADVMSNIVLGPFLDGSREHGADL